MEQRRRVRERRISCTSPNLCHNCGECLYACQYAPPHEFAINVPQTLAEIRLQSYEEYCWPAFMGAAFRRNGVATSLSIAAAFAAVALHRRACGQP